MNISPQGYIYGNSPYSTHPFWNSEGGEVGTMDYNELENKPSINNVTLIDNKTSRDLHIDQPRINDSDLIFD